MNTCVLLRAPESVAKIPHYGTWKKDFGFILSALPNSSDSCFFCLPWLSACACIASHFGICSSGYVGCGTFKMQSRSRWQSAFILTGLLVAETVYSAPTSTQEATTSFKTQYPPSTANARLLLPETQGVSAYQPVSDVPTDIKQYYPTSLEREGHQLQKPTPDPKEVPYRFGGPINDLYGPVSLLEGLLPGLLPATSDAPSTAPAETPVPSVTLPSQETINGPAEATSSPTTAPTSISVPVSTSSSSTSSLTSHSAKPQDTSTSVESIPATSTIMATMANGQDVFLPVSTGPIPGTVKSRNDHPVPRASIVRLS